MLCNHLLLPLCSANNLSLGSHSSQEVLFAIDDPTDIQGSFDGNLQVAVSNQGYCLTSGSNSKGTFEASVELSNPSSFVAFRAYGRGDYQFETYDQDDGWIVHRINGEHNSFTWQTILWKLPNPTGYVRYRVKLTNEDSLFCKLVGPPIIPLDSLWPLTTTSEQFRITIGSWSGTIGVNLEADYLFLELDRSQRKLLLRQAKKDGFDSIRLHKLTRLLQSLRFNHHFRNTLQNFFDDLSDIGLSLYLDILSWPLATSLESGQTIENGWKQWVYISSELQERIKEFIEWLGSFYLGNSRLFTSNNLLGICLFNENSLYAEFQKDIPNNFKNPCERMLKVAEIFRDYLRKKGFTGRVFLSNYQLPGEDQLCNLEFSKSIDRHLYFDYPEFDSGDLKVGGRSPLEFLAFWKSRYFDLFNGASENWISEINLPWPNQFTHEMLPIILALHNEKKLSGLWFYDYRIRSSDFHRGGPFGIQRFRSVIEPLGWFKSLMNEKIKIEYENFLLNISSDKGSVKCILRGHPTLRVPHCIWSRGEATFISGPERALGDQFDQQFLIQKTFGQEAMNLDF